MQLHISKITVSRAKNIVTQGVKALVYYVVFMYN